MEKRIRCEADADNKQENFRREMNYREVSIVYMSSPESLSDTRFGLSGRPVLER
jgi:hypothetical protein